jgi:hypothetical protein
MDRGKGRIVLEFDTLPVKEDVRMSVKQMRRLFLKGVSLTYFTTARYTHPFHKKE